MRYPILTRSECESLAKIRWENDGDLIVEPTWVGEGDDFDETPVQQAAEQCRELIRTNPSSSEKDRVEGDAARHLHEALQPTDSRNSVPVHVLDDPGFWRYLSIRWFWDFIAWRESTPFANGNHMKYLDAKNSTECVLTRMYLRMAALGGGEYGELASVLPSATDFWRSHIIRVRTATAPALVRAMVEIQRDHRLVTKDLREFAKRVNRTWTNVVLNLYEQDEAQKLLSELRSGLGNSDYSGGEPS